MRISGGIHTPRVSRQRGSDRRHWQHERHNWGVVFTATYAGNGGDEVVLMGRRQANEAGSSSGDADEAVQVHPQKICSTTE